MNPPRPAAGPSRSRIPASIWTLGLVSLFTDLGSEMVHALLPLLMVGTFGASALLIGLIEGVAEALVLFTKLFSGYLSDASGRRKPWVLFGYGLAALSKPLIPLSASVGMVATARFADRIGKGIRGAPRDAMIGDLAPPDIRGACFGLRQSMDSVGAVLGPLLAVGLMLLFADDIITVLWFAVVPGVLAVLLLLRLPEPEGRIKPARLPISRAGLASLGPQCWRLVLVALMISLARCSEAFLVLRAVDVGLAATWIPLVLVVMSLSYTLCAWPAGWLSDRMQRRVLLGSGLVMLAIAHLCLALAQDTTLLFVGLIAWGLHLGLSQGVLASLLTDVAPAEYRGTAFGMVSLVSGLGILIASIGAGWLWDRFSPDTAFWAGALLASLATMSVCLAPAGRTRTQGVMQ